MRGFLSVVLVMAMLLLLSRDFAVYDSLYRGTQEMRSDIVLNQQIHERQYELEDGLRLAIAEALETIPPKPELAREYVCAKIGDWFHSYPDYSLYIGYIDPADYSKALSIESTIEPCFNFLYVDVTERKAMLKDNGLIDFPYSLAGYRLAFLFEGKIIGHPFKAIVPEGDIA